MLLVLVALLPLEDAFDLLQSDCIFGQGFASEERFDVITEDEENDGNHAHDANDKEQEDHENQEQGPPLSGLDQLATVAHSLWTLIFLGNVKIGIDGCGHFLIAVECESLEWAVCKDGRSGEGIDMQRVEIGRGS